MGPTIPRDNWADGTAYDGYIGRWSRLAARQFIDWLDVPPGARWLDVGCGTGALSETITQAEPRSVIGIDPAPAYLAMARENVRDKRAKFVEGSAQAIPENDASYDAAVSGLMLNLVPEPATAIREMARVTNRGGTVAVYVWDYADSMQLLRYFWDAAAALDPAATKLDEGRRLSVCNDARLRECFASAGLRGIATRLIRVVTPFRDFDDYWSPFLSGQGPAGAWVASLSAEQRDELREHLRSTLPIQADGSIELIAGAWAARGAR